MDPKRIAAIITAAARFMGISPRAVPCDPASSETYQLALVRRCVIAQLSHMGLEDETIRAALRLRPLEYTRHLRVGTLLRHFPHDAAVHNAIHRAVPEAFTIPYQEIPIARLIESAAICGGVHIDEVRKLRSGRCNARDYRSAALLIAVSQNCTQPEILSAFRLSATTNKLSMVKSARQLSTVDIRFCKIVRRILNQANLATA